MNKKTEKKMVKVYRDLNAPAATTQYRNGAVRYKFHPNSTEFEVEENHVAFVVRDCVDLFRTKPKGKNTAATAKTDKPKSGGE